METGLGCLQVEPFHYELGSCSHTEGRLDDIGRYDGCIPPYTDSSQLKEISSLHLPRNGFKFWVMCFGLSPAPHVLREGGKVALFLDNTTSLAYFGNQGGMKSVLFPHYK